MISLRVKELKGNLVHYNELQSLSSFASIVEMEDAALHADNGQSNGNQSLLLSVNVQSRRKSAKLGAIPIIGDGNAKSTLELQGQRKQLEHWMPNGHLDVQRGPKDPPCFLTSVKSVVSSKPFVPFKDFATFCTHDPGIDLEIPWQSGLHDFSGYSDFSYTCMPRDLYLILDPLPFYPIPPFPTLILKGNEVFLFLLRTSVPPLS
ncbi:hypothetical protein MJG53_011508 [Ovis ammon polii x Ovis aries]|uniref:Uncharacterized protein n=1 Tax=Ovis ammon polii x Ovis aries TaxID=2918886 RepID=A0ACB9UNZ4_9CETA|nr:hypothetical protein MJG53_011508 [Ovis ammon polii x Ovis aries]